MGMGKLVAVGLVCLLCSGSLVAASGKPRLILQITVDGLRGDLLERYRHHFGKGGFRYLLDEGVVYSNAHYQHANTETIVGHATLATGAQPATHGLIGNVWYDKATGELAYNIEDPAAPLLATRKTPRESVQLDPAQKQARSDGRSPRAMLVPTFSDTLVSAGGGQVKNFAVSGKDRGAVSMAGQTGKAFWYSTDTGDFQSSSYYYETYPRWVEAWNGLRKAESNGGRSWQLLQPKDKYLWASQDDRPYEVDLKGYGRTFPHAYGEVSHPLFATRLLVSPEGDRLLMDFAKALISAEQLGQDGVTDYLSISFSAVDAVNHFFGVASLENEDVVVQLDQTLSELFTYIDKQVGLRNTVIVLSADHGMPEMPEYMQELGFPAGRKYNEQVPELANRLGKKLFGVESIARTFFRPSLYLDHDTVRKAGLDFNRVARQLAEELSAADSIGAARATSELLSREHSGTARQMQLNSHPQRSGDIYVAQAPYWFMFAKGAVAAMHGSPWNYDTHVPIIFAGAGIKADRLSRPVHPVDIAPTLSAVLEIPAPAAAQGQVLEEVLH
jgi:predicted AlkP superfamily pyrophosphatase or phosphodiesterase